MKLDNAAVKKQNKISIFRHLLKNSGITKPEISTALSLSLPTVGKIISELIETGLVEEQGMQVSSGGRRAIMLSVKKDFKVAMGIDITRHHVGMVILNLAGEILAWERKWKLFENTDLYRQEVEELAVEFLEEYQIPMEKLIGIGMSFPGIISQQENMVEVSHVLETLEPWYQNGMLESVAPVQFFNDATAVCMAEVYTQQAPANFTLISLSNSVGGCRVSNNKVEKGDHNRNGEIGHMCIIPGGRMCYCGKKGHFDAYCCARILANQSKSGTVEGFFEELEQGDPECIRLFEEYMDYLAIMICNLHMETDYPVVLGGYVGSYLEKYLPGLCDKVREMDLFAEQSDFIYLCHYNVEGAAVGSARYYIEQYIEML